LDVQGGGKVSGDLPGLWRTTKLDGVRIELIAVPYDSGRRGERMGAGPEHLLRAGLRELLAQAGHVTQVQTIEIPSGRLLGEVQAAFALARSVAQVVREAAARGAFPLVLSGNCGPAALGAVAGLGREPWVVWLDAHADFNTPETTASGFWDGMALATLAGRCWRQLGASIPGFRPVAEHRVIVVGARHLDPLERAALQASRVRWVAADQVDGEWAGVLDGAARDAAYLHLDLDVMDPAEGRANGYAEPNGLRRAQIEQVIRRVAAKVPIKAAALTAFDPAADPGSQAGEAAVRLCQALADAASGGDRGGPGEPSPG
jgi:arginase